MISQYEIDQIGKGESGLWVWLDKCYFTRQWGFWLGIIFVLVIIWVIVTDTFKLDGRE